MTAEGRKQRAIDITMDLFYMAMKDPRIIIEMIASDVSPKEIEDKLVTIMEYLNKRAPEAKEAEKAHRIETHRKAVAKKWGVEEENEE